MFTVYADKRPHGKKRSLIGECEKRQQARQMCRNREYELDGLIIVHPSGEEEPWQYSIPKLPRSH